MAYLLIFPCHLRNYSFTIVLSAIIILMSSESKGSLIRSNLEHSSHHVANVHSMSFIHNQLMAESLTSSSNNHTFTPKEHLMRMAVVRTFCSKDANELVDSFHDWNRVSPCSETFKTDSYGTDLYLIFSQSLSESKEASEAVSKAEEIFDATNGWGGCFENIFSLGVNIDPAMDVYMPSKQLEDENWVNGPNRQFERSIRAVQQSQFFEYETLYLMESDSIPVKHFWLDTLVNEVENHRPFAILGSKYDGDKWDSFYDQLPLSLVNHINGNAIYNITHPLINLVVSHLEEEAATPYNSIPYDYRISQIMVEAETGIEANIPTLIWNKYKQSGWYQSSSLYDTFLQSILQYVPDHPIKETKFIANYAATNIVPSHLGEAKIIHGAKMYENWNKTKQKFTLVVSDWHDGNFAVLLSNLDKSNHPFSDILVMLPLSVDIPVFKHNEKELKVKFYRRKETEKDYFDMCSAPVETTWFAMTNSYHRVVRKATQMLKRDGERIKPVVPFVFANYENCLKYSSCAKKMKVSESINKNDEGRYVLDFEMVYNTDKRDEFCNFMTKRKELLMSRQELEPRHENSFEQPSATAYLAYLSLNSEAQYIYDLVDKAKFGSRKMFVQVIPYPELQHEITDDPESFQRFLVEDNSKNVTECDKYDSEEECLNGGPNCKWRPNFDSCYTDNTGDNECNIIPLETDSQFEYASMELDGIGKLSANTILTWEKTTSDFVANFIADRYDVSNDFSMETSLLCQNPISERRRKLQNSPTKSNIILYRQRVVGNVELDGVEFKEIILEPFQEQSNADQYTTMLKERDIAENGNSSDFVTLEKISNLKTIEISNPPSRIPSQMPSNSPSTSPSKVYTLTPTNTFESNEQIKTTLLFTAVIVASVLITLICIAAIWIYFRGKKHTQNEHTNLQDDEESSTSLYAVSCYERGLEL